MPYERPGAGYYTTATKAVKHGFPVVENGIAGIAIKQKAPSWQDGLAAQDQIAIGESFHIRVGGIRQVAALGGAAKGNVVYITTATNALTLTDPTTNGQRVGKVVELAGQRGCPTGFMRVHFDL